MYALLLSIVTKHYKLGLFDRKLILCDNYQDVQAGFSPTKYQKRVTRYHTSNKCIQHNDRKEKSRKSTKQSTEN